MRALFSCVVTCLMVLSPPARAASAIDVDAQGMIRALVDWPGEMPVRGSVWIVRDEWKSIQQQWSLQQIKYSPFAERRSISGRFDVGSAGIDLTQQIAPDSLDYTLRASADLDVTGVYWCCELPTDTFAGGSVSIGDESIALPVSLPEDGWMRHGSGNGVTLTSRDGAASVVFTLPERYEIRVQDARLWNEPRFQVHITLAEQKLSAGQAITFSTKVQARLSHDDTPALIQIRPDAIRSEFDGFGGNFVYAIESPTTDLALERFKLTWARIGIEGAKWEPRNDNDDPLQTNVSLLASKDVPNSPLRERFELDRRLFKLAEGRLIASIWYPPEFLFAEPLPFRDRTGTIPRKNWPELAENLTSYLLHLKVHYGVEPALFSFNESDIGINVLLSGEELRDLTLLLGERFSEAGLRTKILLGDSADLAKGLAQIQPTLEAPAAMKHVGALAYHPWSGQNEYWDDWATLAERHGLMLMATEMGADPLGWRDGSFNSPLSTMRLARRYIEQLRDAKTQVMLEWEWTGDYPVTEPGPDGTPVLSRRGEFLRQLTQTTPTQASVVDSSCDRDSILTATVLSDDQKTAAVHLLNRGAARKVTIAGLPATLSLATLFVIDPVAGERTPIHVETVDGRCEIEIPPGAIATLAFPRLQ